MCAPCPVPALLPAAACAFVAAFTTALFLRWQGLLAKRMKPPLVPHVKGPTDLSSFDEMEDHGMGNVTPYVCVPLALAAYGTAVAFSVRFHCTVTLCFARVCVCVCRPDGSNWDGEF